MAVKERYTVRLYRLHDLDLITFAVAHQFNIMGAIYAALSAFARGETFSFKIPPRKTEKLPQLKRIYIKVLTLDMEKDKDAIEILSNIVPGCRNSFLKNLLRLYLCTPLSEEYFKEVKRDRGSGEILYQTPVSEMMKLYRVYDKKFSIFWERKDAREIPLMPEREYKNQYTKEYTAEELLERQARIQKCKEKKEEQKQKRMEARANLNKEFQKKMQDAVKSLQKDISHPDIMPAGQNVEKIKDVPESDIASVEIQNKETAASINTTVHPENGILESVTEETADDSINKGFESGNVQLGSFTGMTSEQEQDPVFITKMFAAMQAEADDLV